MNNQRIKTIARELEAVCYEVEKRIVGHTESDARAWAQSNALRHARTLVVMLDYCIAAQVKSLAVANMSGIGWGHQDFSIITYLRHAMGKIAWHVFDTKNNPAFAMAAFEEMMRLCPEIQTHYTDFNDAQLRFDGQYDVVLFTEIAEHLDYSTLLKMLRQIRQVLKPGGIVIITTPNLLSFWNRRCFLLGKGDVPFWGDGTANLDAGFFGHIMLYDLSRMRRLLWDVGLEPVIAETFTFVHGRYHGKLHGIKAVIHDWLCNHGVHIGTNLFIAARPSVIQKPIPLAS